MIDFSARWLLDHLPASYDERLVHNDFRNGNMMVSPASGVVAVLDWEVTLWNGRGRVFVLGGAED